MVGLPSVESREKILRTLLSKEKTENLDFQELAQMTDGYSGSDLKVCHSSHLALQTSESSLYELIIVNVIQTELLHNSSISTSEGADKARVLERPGKNS